MEKESIMQWIRHELSKKFLKWSNKLYRPPEGYNGVHLIVVYKDGYQEMCAACKYCGGPTQTTNRTCHRCTIWDI